MNELNIHPTMIFPQEPSVFDIHKELSMKQI